MSQVNAEVGVKKKKNRFIALECCLCVEYAWVNWSQALHFESLRRDQLLNDAVMESTRENPVSQEIFHRRKMTLTAPQKLFLWYHSTTNIHSTEAVMKEPNNT